MNNRIKDLSLRASNAAHEALKAKEYSADKPWQYIYADKFASLIIRECASLANTAENSETWTEPVGNMIKKHFGVK